MRAKRFTADRYREFFPYGNRAAEFASMLGGNDARREMRAPTVEEYADRWLPRQRPPLIRPARRRDYIRDITRVVLPTIITDGVVERRIGDLLVTELAPRHLHQLRERLLARPLALKTVRNIMDGSFRAMMRDCRTVDLLIVTDPFCALKRPRVALPLPDPFTVAERDALLARFRDHRRFYYSFVYTLFHTGQRPSEAAALRWGAVDLQAGTLTITVSRYLGKDSAPKTAGSRRTIAVIPEVRQLLRALQPLHAGPAGYVFTNAKNGGPINQSEWPKDHWNTALRATGIRPRKFYATRHTFISIALSRGVNLKWLAEYCGTSVAMIERSYGRFLADSGESQLDLLGSVNRGVEALRLRPDRGRKNRDLGGGVSVLRRKTLAG
jgi:integrase